MLVKIKAEKSDFNRKFLQNRLNEDLRNKNQALYEAKLKSKGNVISFYAYADDEIIGGVVGVVEPTSWVKLEAIFIAEKYRHLDLGIRLIEQLSKAASKKSCIGLMAEVLDCQNLQFFEKVGFTTFGKLDNCPPQHCVYYMKKVL